MREMKNSGIEWIGEIPKDWNLMKIKNAISMLGSGGTPQSNQYLFYENGSVPWIQSGDIYGKNSIQESKVMITNLAVKATSSLRIYDPDFIIIAMYGGSVGNLAIVKIKACVNQACCCIKPNTKNDLKYMYYWLFLCQEDFLKVSEGGGQPNISQNKIKNQYYLEPDFEEQRIISNYLDAKCVEIDALTQDIQSQIDTLQQYKQSVITEAVTKGLDPDVEMKDSGVDWCPKIPEHWITTNPKTMFSLRNQRAFSGERQLTASQKYGIIYQDEFMEIENQKVVTVAKDFSILKHVEPNDFVISMRSFQGGLEYSEKRGSISSAYVMLIPNDQKVYPPFYRWFFKSCKYINALQSTTNLVRDGQAMRYSNFVMVPLFIIPILEQKAIADFLNSKICQVDLILDEKQKQLDILADYKKSLIYEYVTGKKEI